MSIHENPSIVNYFNNSVKQFPNSIAITCDEHKLSYQELEALVNKFTHYLLAQNINTNKPVVILLERSLFCYISILAIIKLGGTYVPIETDYPDERINLILEDIEYSLLITSSKQSIRSNLKFDKQIAINIDEEHADIMNMQSSLIYPDKKVDLNKTCYIIYTSGSTGKPKGVEVSYNNLYSYINAAQQHYKISNQDVIYQGFSLAFDASLEEIWMAFAHGAQLVVATDKAIRSGLDLHDFLNENKVSVLSTVPSLLNNINEDIPSLRLLILGGEVCLPKIIDKWHHKDRKIFNTYGPTETTVIATIFECLVNNEINIGKPIHGYEIIIVDENNKVTNDVGELCIGGNGVAKGYVNKPELTKQKFILDPRGTDKVFYKTGDKAELNDHGEIIFHGRIDEQVKIRGFRVELTDIESIINKFPDIQQAIAVYNIEDDLQLTVYLVPEDKNEINLELLKSYLKENLPDYMIPNNFELIHYLPLLPSGKVDKTKLPKPKACKDTVNYVSPESDLEIQITEIWKKIFKREVSTIADFFYDLGGNSLLAAKAVSEMRKINSLQKISLVDIYSNPNIKSFAEKFVETNKKNSEQTNKKKCFCEDTKPYHVPGWKHKLCGFAQLISCLLHYAIYSWQFLLIYLLYTSIDKSLNNYALSFVSIIVLSLAIYPVCSLAFSIICKWLLVGKIKPGKYKLWGGFYFRWWLYSRIIQTCITANMLVGTPIIIIYYRLLGAKIGKNCFIGSPFIFAPDLLTIGDNTSIGSHNYLTGYTVENGWLIISSINIGKNCYIGSKCAFGKNTIMEDNSSVENMSSIPDFTTIPESTFYAGSPCVKSTTPDNHITGKLKEKPITSSSFDKTKYSFLHYFGLYFISMVHILAYLPMYIGTYMLLNNNLHYWSLVIIPVSSVLSLLLYFSSTIFLKKYLFKKLSPGTYSIYSYAYVRQWMLSNILRSPEVLNLGDSLFFPMFLRKLGAKIGQNVELGDSIDLYPDFMEFDKESFAATYATVAQPSIYKNQVLYDKARVGHRGFVGNDCILPAGSSVGNGSLLGCISIPPNNNESAKDNTSWLGSPAIYLPKREKIKNFSYNLIYEPSKALKLKRYAIESIRMIFPICLIMLLAFIFIKVLFLLKNYGAMSMILGLPLVSIGAVILTLFLMIAVKKIFIGKWKAGMKPLWCTFIWKNDIMIYWRDLIVTPLFLSITYGTPFLSMYFRMLGAKIGKKVFIETHQLFETDLVDIGDYACINKDAVLQTHLYEDRIYKMSSIQIQSNCNIGKRTVILYDTKMESGANIGIRSLLMKGESLPKNTHWEGIPAQYKK